MAGKIFVNYRRDDSPAHAISVAQYLEATFGKRNVFLDIDRMRAGQSFPTAEGAVVGQQGDAGDLDRGLSARRAGVVARRSGRACETRRLVRRRGRRVSVVDPTYGYARR